MENGAQQLSGWWEYGAKWTYWVSKEYNHALLTQIAVRSKAVFKEEIDGLRKVCGALTRRNRLIP